MQDEYLWKYGGLVLLTLQQASMPLMVKYSRNREESNVFITTVNVFFMEVIKITVCSAILIYNARSVQKFWVQISEAMTNWVETGKVCLPALIYTLQNNLYYIALSNLEATTFCAFYQLKILTTALMFRLILNRALSYTQWCALLVLVVGVTDVQMQYQPPANEKVVENSSLGFACVIAMCFTSAFAGVYLEKVLKGSEVNVFVQNIRIASVGLIISGFSMLYNDAETIQRDGLFRGFDTLVWIMTTTNSVGGLLIAIVIRYADNILKIYAQSAAIIGAAIGSWILFDFTPNLLFSAGVGLVMSSMYLYSNHRTRKNMLPFVQLIVSRAPGLVRYLVLPVAAVVGTVGYYVEQRLSKPKAIPYLDTSIHDQRQQRQMKEAILAESLAEEKSRIVPRSSLTLNTGRSAHD